MVMARGGRSAGNWRRLGWMHNWDPSGKRGDGDSRNAQLYASHGSPELVAACRIPRSCKISLGRGFRYKIPSNFGWTANLVGLASVAVHCLLSIPPSSRPKVGSIHPPPLLDNLQKLPPPKHPPHRHRQLLRRPRPPPVPLHLAAGGVINILGFKPPASLHPPDNICGDPVAVHHLIALFVERRWRWWGMSTIQTCLKEGKVCYVARAGGSIDRWESAGEGGGSVHVDGMGR